MSDTPALYPPRHAIVLAHPSARSFNALVAETYCAAVRRNGQEAILRNLYALRFDPVLKASERPGKNATKLEADVLREHAALRGSDVIVFVYPIWFGMPPAMLKGYIDRVLGAGVTASDVQARAGTALLAGKRLVSITSSGASKAWLRQQSLLEALHTLFEDYLAHAFGMKARTGLHFGETVEGLAQDFIDPLLGQVQHLADTLCAELAEDRTRESCETAA